MRQQQRGITNLKREITNDQREIKNSGKFQNNSINDVKQISLNHVISYDNRRNVPIFCSRNFKTATDRLLPGFKVGISRLRKFLLN